jgi:Reverse transcriptase (RNA-dependent DNA polymerase)
VRYETVCTPLVLAVLEQWYFLVVDIKSAYLYGPLEEEIYMEQPEGYHVQPGKVWKLLKALYILKQAGYIWWKELKKSMYAMNYHCTKSDSGVFVHKTSDGIVITIVYVDDSIFFGTSLALVAAKHKEFMERWECHNLGEPKEFLHMHICRPDLSNIFLDQTTYLHKVLARFGQTNARPAPTPLPAGYYPIANQGEVNLQLRSNYQELIGSLLYLMIGTRLDIAFAVTKLAQHAANL